jgi:hypothetical protein
MNFGCLDQEGFEKAMKILKEPISQDELKKIASEKFGDLVKAVVDVSKGLLAIDAELHSDLEALLLDDGSKQSDLWGINFYPFLEAEDFVEFDSMINIRPSQGNTSRGVDDEAIRSEILAIADRWVTG